MFPVNISILQDLDYAHNDLIKLKNSEESGPKGPGFALPLDAKR
jgi:hypothetical protein